jgi:hypothetical protein
MPGPIHQTWSMNNIGSLADVLTGTERVLNTPLPIAYTISISQITWAYVLVLPFQLYNYLDWVTIPGTMLAAYIILGLSKMYVLLLRYLLDQTNYLSVVPKLRTPSATMSMTCPWTTTAANWLPILMS